MGPQSYMHSVVERNVDMRRMTVYFFKSNWTILYPC